METEEIEETYITALLENVRTREVGIALLGKSSLLLIQISDNAHYVYTRSILQQFTHSTVLLPASSSNSAICRAVAATHTPAFLPRRSYSEENGLRAMNRALIGLSTGSQAALASSTLTLAVAAAAAALAQPPTPVPAHSLELELPRTGRLAIDSSLLFGSSLLPRRGSPGRDASVGLVDSIAQFTVTSAGAGLLRATLAAPHLGEQTTYSRQQVVRWLFEHIEISKALQSALLPGGHLVRALTRLTAVCAKEQSREKALSGVSIASTVATLTRVTEEIESAQKIYDIITSVGDNCPEIITLTAQALQRSLPAATEAVQNIITHEVPPIPSFGDATLTAELRALLSVVPAADAALVCAQRSALTAVGRAMQEVETLRGRWPALDLTLLWRAGAGLHVGGIAPPGHALPDLHRMSTETGPGAPRGRQRGQPFQGTNAVLDGLTSVLNAALADGSIAIMHRLSEQVQKLQSNSDVICGLADAVALIDMLNSFARFAQHFTERGAPLCWPKIGQQLSFSGLRPPLLLLTMSSLPTPHSLMVTPEKPHAVVVGENAAGKSVLLAAIAHAVVLAHAGAALPALDVTVPVVQAMRGCSGHAEDDAATLLVAAEDGGLCIFDEPLRGTAEPEATALLWAALERSSSGLMTVTATHFLPIARAAASHPSFTTWHMESQPVPYTLRPGITGAAPGYGVRLLSDLGAPKSFVINANRVITLLRASAPTSSTVSRLRSAAISPCRDTEFKALLDAARLEDHVCSTAAATPATPFTVTPATVPTPALPRLSQVRGITPPEF